MNRFSFRFFFIVSALVLSMIVPAASLAQDAVTLNLWTFWQPTADWYMAVAERYKEEVNPNFTLNVTVIGYDDMHTNLQVALQSGGVGAPDIADIEQGRFGGFLRGGNPGLVDLTPYLEDGGYTDQLVNTRQALYSYGGATYCLEQALTPVVLLYRADVFEEAGFDPNTFETWDDFAEAAQTLSSDTVKALPIIYGAETLEILIHQRNADFFDADGNVTLDSQPVIDTMNWMLDQIDAGVMDVPTGNVWEDFTSGKYLAHIAADWGTGVLASLSPDLSGKWKAAPLPAFEPGLPRTSVYGGTGGCIVATSPNAEEAWKFLEFAYLTTDSTISRVEMVGNYPAFLPAMTDPRLADITSEYFSGQKLNELYAQLAPEAPAQYQSPYRTELKSLLSTAWQDIIDRNRTPEEVFTEISEEIRATMAEEAEE